MSCVNDESCVLRPYLIISSYICMTKIKNASNIIVLTTHKRKKEKGNNNLQLKTNISCENISWLIIFILHILYLSHTCVNMHACTSCMSQSETDEGRVREERTYINKAIMEMKTEQGCPHATLFSNCTFHCRFFL